MNKFFILGIIFVLLIAGGITYKVYFRPPERAPIQASGAIKEVNIVVRENTWKWDPDTITVKAGDKIRLKIFNEDSYDHGFALEIFGINKRTPAKQETIIEFEASKKGDFPFYCSVPCGKGHYTQRGHIIVTE